NKPDHGWYFITRHATTSGTVKEIAERFNPGRGSFRFAGFSYISVRANSFSYSLRGLCVPHWFLALLFAVLPTISFAPSSARVVGISPVSAHTAAMTSAPHQIAALSAGPCQR